VRLGLEAQKGTSASDGADGIAAWGGPEGTRGEFSNRPGGYSGPSANAGLAGSTKANAMIERFIGSAFALTEPPSKVDVDAMPLTAAQDPREMPFVHVDHGGGPSHYR
jgi:hypothetical protein